MKHLNMNRLTFWAFAAATSLGMVGTQVAHAVQLADGTTHFESPPRLIDSAIREQSVADNNVKYFFLLSVPDNAGESLERVEIVQENGTVFTREIDFEPEESIAYIGHRRRVGEQVSISHSEFDDETNTIALTFDPPIPPGTDLTIRLNAERNPRRSGIYLLGVTVYPEGDIPQGQFLGFGRFHIYDNDNDWFR
jgi:hypothetical protein